jgi:neutral ceramidase
LNSALLKALVASCVAAGMLPRPVAGNTLKAGVAKVEITPPPGVMMWGYFDRLTPARGTLDPLYARVLVLQAGDTKIALVDLDLGRAFGPASLEKIRDTARQSAGISYVMVMATHTHAGPVVMDEYPDGGPAWENAAIGKIGKAIDEAARNVVEAKLGTGYGKTYIGYNRRQVNADGTVTMIWENPERHPTAPVDPTVSVLRVDTVDGKPLAVLVNYACHPVIFGNDNLDYSADFPGVMTQTVEAAFSKSGSTAPLTFFLQGAPGDINVFDAGAPRDKAPEKRDWSGQHLGEEAARVALKVHTESSGEPSIDFAEDVLDFHLRWNPDKFREAILAGIGPQAFKIYSPPIKEEMRLPVMTVLLNKTIAIMGMPGEPFVDFQIEWRARCPVKDAFFLGYADGYNGYFPTIKAASEGGYGTASASTWVEVGAGEDMVEHSLMRLDEMLGRLHDLPEDLKN